MIFPSLDRVKAIAPGYDIVPVYMEILSDVRTPISVLKALKQVSSHTYLLESADNSNHWGRYSFLGYDPKIELFCKNHKMTIKDGTTRTFECSDPAAEIRNILSQYKSPRLEELPTFTGGFVGYFACEYIRYIEPTLDFPTPDDDPAMVNDVDLMLFDKVIAFDHYKNKIYLIANISTNDLERNYNKAELELKALADLVVNGKEADIPKGILKTEFTSEFTKDEFEAVVKKTQHYIKEGDIFQCVVSNRREAEFDGSLLNAYRVLRTLNPSPYMFYLSGGDVELTGASPETLVKLTDGKMYTFPIAGTMRRGKTEAEDLAIEEKLINDEKELAEHNMLVDLGRNDLGKIAKFGSVQVEALHMLQRFSHVIHITSTVSGDIQDGKDALDAIGATLPAGTLSGAPKIRAIEILHELEKSPRGVYGGAVGYIDFSGNMDVCIGIRMAMNKGGKVYVRAGAGYDNIDLAAATAHNVVAENTPGQNSNAVAELVLGMLVYGARNFYNGKSGSELMGKKLGILAFGNVGRNVARIAKGFGMEVYAYDAFCPKDVIEAAGVKAVDNQEALFETCDIVSLHIPATPETKQSINYALVNKMAKGGTLINTARKEVINEPELIKLMAEREDLKFITDIKPDADAEFAKFEGRYFSTPKKMGAQTAEANINAGIAAAKQINAFFATGDTKFQVNK